MAALAADLGVLRTRGCQVPSRRITAVALLLAACSHLEPLSNAYSPFSRELGQGVGRGPLQNEGVAAVSIHGLVSKPAIYHHRRVRTDGYVKLQFEATPRAQSRSLPIGKNACGLTSRVYRTPAFGRGEQWSRAPSTARIWVT